MRVIVVDGAEQDLQKGKEFYDEKGEDVGDYFLDSLSADIESLAIFGGIHPKRGRFHRSLAHIFPYAIYYTVEQQEIKAWAVLDCRRNPAWIRNQLRGRR